MRVLLVKTSSLGDLIHTLPALTDAASALEEIRFHWVVEESFAEVPGWHPAVEETIPIALRRWRRGWRRALRSGEPRSFLRHLRANAYDCVLDAQGLLLKSGVVALLACGPRSGYDRASAREPWVSWTYHHRYPVSRSLHAVERTRRLFAAALGYPLPSGGPDYGIRRLGRPRDLQHPYLVFLLGTTWPSKQWPWTYWAALVQLATEGGYRVCFPWHSPEDRLQAERVIAAAGAGELLPRGGLTELAARLAAAAGVAGVDTGLAHLAAAVGVPSVTLYGPTRVDLTGALGPRQLNLAADFPCAPCLQRRCGFSGRSEVAPACFETLPPDLVWAKLQVRMKGESDG
jgi:heptosyltransferase-1